MTTTASPRANGGVVYVDTSILVAALSPNETHHHAARVWLSRNAQVLVTSVITEVELKRALARCDAPADVRKAAARLLATCESIDLVGEIRELASALQPVSTRSLDALHVATAVVAAVDSFVTLDIRQRVAAEEATLTLATI